MLRGRVIARSGGTLLVRTPDGDKKHTPSGKAQPGDLVEAEPGKPPRVVRAYLRGDYPTPENETARLSTRRIEFLRKRAKAIAVVREFFTSHAFLEVETPLRVPSPGLELHLDAVPAGQGAYLITSPEYQMKRLLAAGLDRIFTLCKCFRAGEQGDQHNSEFTMLEWYRGWAQLELVLEDTERLVAAVAAALNGDPVVHVGDRTIDVSPPWPRMTVAEAMDHYARLRVVGDETAEALRERVDAAGFDVGSATAWDDVFYSVFVDKVEPALAALDRPTFLIDWPAPLAALAQRQANNPLVVDRFEAYIGGIELANAFGELTDPVEQRSRFVDDQLSRQERGKPVYPIDEKLITALEEGLPPSAGCALGVDRLVMLVTGAPTIADVLTFTADEL